jgi:hypothetical protein
MQPILIAMLIWADAQYNGAPAVLPGFQTMAACDQARPLVEAAYRDFARRLNPVSTRCITLPAGEPTSPNHP